MEEELKELEALQPLSSIVNIKGIAVEVKPFKFRQLFMALKHVSNLVSEINTYEDQTVQILRVLGEHPEDVIGLISLSSGQPITFFEDLDAEEGIDLALAVWTVNKDFFSQKIQPKLVKIGLLNSPKTQTQMEESETKSE